jgi:hypothetical protein
MKTYPEIPPIAFPATTPIISTKETKKPQKSHSEKKMTFFRILLLFVILGFGIAAGWILFSIINGHQLVLYEKDFRTMVASNHRAIEHSLYVKQLLNIQVAVNSGLNCPLVSDWPYCNVDVVKFPARARILREVAEIGHFVVAPIVRPEARQSFESAARVFSPRSVGIWTISSDGVPMLSPSHSNDTVHDITVPVLQVSDVAVAQDLFLFDLYTIDLFQTELDTVIECVATATNPQDHCSTISDIIPSSGSNVAIISAPIIPYFNSSEIVGFAVSEFTWESVIIATALPSSNFDCLLESTSTNEKLYFSVKDGFVKEIHEDKLQTDQRQMRQTFYLNSTRSSSLGGEPKYTITYYSVVGKPSQYLAIVVFVCCISIAALITGIFVMYNSLVKREVKETHDLLDSKRVFVRFISHEIR